MQSFSIWYKGESGNPISDYNPRPEVTLHVNLWDFSLNDQVPVNSPSLDIGIEIRNFDKLDELRCYIPVSCSDLTINDLSPKLNNPEIADLVFNTHCSCNSQSDGLFLEKDGLEFLLCSVQKHLIADAYYEASYETETNSDMIRVTIHCDKIKKAHKSINNLYCRFRVSSKKVSDLLFNKIKKNSDWFLVSGHIERKIVDIRINRERDIDANFNKLLRSEQFELANLKQVNFLIMEAVSNEIMSTEGEDLASRIVETGWAEYLDCSEKVKQDLNNHNIMAYHWKQEEERVSYSKTVRITEYKSTVFMIIVYMFIILIIGIIGSLIASFCFHWLTESPSKPQNEALPSINAALQHSYCTIIAYIKQWFK